MESFWSSGDIMDIYVYYSIGIFSAFIILIFIYLLYEKLFEIWKMKKEKVYKQEILPYIDGLFAEIEEVYPREDHIMKLKNMAKVKLKREIITNRILYYLSMFTGNMQKNIVKLSEEIGLVEYEIEELKSKDHFKRALAAKDLGELRIRKSAPTLLRTLNKESSDIQYHILMALAKIGDEGAFIAGFNKIGRRKLRLSERSLTEVIDSYEGDKRTLYKEMIESSNVYLSTLFIKSAGNYMDIALSDLISKYLKDEYKDRRIAAIKAIGQSGDIRFINQIVEKLKDEEWEVRAAAAKSIGRIGGYENLDSLVDALGDREWWVRFNAARSILEIPQGTNKLAKVMEGQDRFAKDILISAMEDSGVLDDIYLYENATEKEKRQLFEQLQKYKSQH